MEDRIIANTLEQATSSDFNAAQTGQARRLSDFIASEFAAHNVPLPVGNIGNVARDIDEFRPVVTGLNVLGGTNPDGVIVSAGTLTQTLVSSESGTQLTGLAWTATTRDPYTTVQTGINRTYTSVPYVSTAGRGLAYTATEAWHLLCARLVEVVTLTSTVNIFDVPTQAFVPTALTKRTELRIEFQWFLGTALSANGTVMPALDVGGADWEPIAYVSFVYPGGTANVGRVIDVARRVEGLAGGWQSPGATAQDNATSLPAELLARLASARSPDCGTAQGGTLSGVVSGAINGERALFASSPDHGQFSIVDATDGASPADWALVHYYLCPMQGAYRRRWPLTSNSSATPGYFSSVARGLIVGSGTQPTRRRTNSGAITLYESAGTRGKYNNCAPVAAGTALYIGSGHSYGSSGYNAIYPMVQSSGGGVLYPLGEGSHWLCPLVTSGGAGGHIAPLAVSLPLALGQLVPRLATAVHLHFQLMGETDYASVICEIRNAVDVTAHSVGGLPGAINAYAGERLASAEIIGGLTIATANANLWNFASCTIRVPVGWEPMAAHADAQDPTQGYHLNLLARITSRTTGTYVTEGFQIRLLGWEI